MKKLLLLLPSLAACTGTTGSGEVDFAAFASGPAGIAPGVGVDAIATGFHVELDQAKMHLGAVYLDATPCTGGSTFAACGDPSVVRVAQVTSGVDVDVLSPSPQPFASLVDAEGAPLPPGSGILQAAQSAEVWLSGGDVNAATDNTPIVCVAGIATRGADKYPFVAQITISAGNRGIGGVQASQPGLNPICQQRIVGPICLPSYPAVVPAAGALRVTVDPHHWFDNVDFSQLAASDAPYYASAACDFGKLGRRYVVPDARAQAATPPPNGGLNGAHLFQSVESSDGVFSFQFQSP